jgi:ribonuclease D
MSSEVRTFIIPDANPDQVRHEVAAFLRSVVIDRIDTAYADGAWRILVLYQDARRKEESEQIESAIKGTLLEWREREAGRSGINREAIVSDELIAEIAHYAPTTERELSTIVAAHGADVGLHGAAIVQAVKAMLDALID